MKFSPRTVSISLYGILFLASVAVLGLGIFIINGLYEPISRQVSRGLYHTEFYQLKNDIQNLIAEEKSSINQVTFTVPPSLEPLMRSTLEHTINEQYGKTFLAQTDGSLSILSWPYGQTGFYSLDIPATYHAVIKEWSARFIEADDMFFFRLGISDRTNVKKPWPVTVFAHPVTTIPTEYTCSSELETLKRIAANVLECDDPRVAAVETFELTPFTDLSCPECGLDYPEQIPEQIFNVFIYRDLDPTSTSNHASVLVQNQAGAYLIFGLYMEMPSFYEMCFDCGIEFSESKLAALKQEDIRARATFNNFISDFARSIR